MNGCHRTQQITPRGIVIAKCTHISCTARRQSMQPKSPAGPSLSHCDAVVDRTEVDYAAERVLQTLRKFHGVDLAHFKHIYEIKKLACDLPVYDRRNSPSPQTTRIVQILSDLLDPPPGKGPSHFAHFRQQHHEIPTELICQYMQLMCAYNI